MRGFCVRVSAIALLILCSGQAMGQVAAKFTSFGTGCSSANTKPPVLTSTGPVVDTIFDITVQNVQKSGLALVVIGLSDTYWKTHNVSLPQNLAFLGAPNCTLYASGECLEYCPTAANGTMWIRAQVPNDKRLIGTAVYMQVLTTDPGANAAAVAVSAGYKAVFGG